MWHSHGLLSSCIKIFPCPADQMKLLKLMITTQMRWSRCHAFTLFHMYVCIFIFCWVVHRSTIEWDFNSRRIGRIVCIHNWGCLLRELWSALVGWRHSVQPSEPLFSCLFIYKVDEDEQIWNLPIRVMSQYLSGGTREWVCFVDRALCWPPFPHGFSFESHCILNTTHPLHA